MPYCSLEEAWGSDFKNADYYAKVNQPPMTPSSTIQSRIPPELAENIPSYSSVPSVSKEQTMQSNIVPYKVNFPDRSKRNYIHPIENNYFDELEDNENDTRYIDMQRKIKPDNDQNYLTSNDYFLYKKYLYLAEKYKAKLRKRFKDFMIEDDNKEIMESFSNISVSPTMTGNDSYSFKDIFIIVIVGIFIIFALDIFVKMGSRMK